MTTKKIIKQVMLWLGIERNQTSHSEKAISAVGAFCGIFVTILLSMWLLETAELKSPINLMIVASFGATAVLVFAVPHGALSQPWQVFGGHTLSGLVGVTCQLQFGQSPEIAALAVGLSVAFMYYFRCIHPPGGATALTAVIGGAEITNLGYTYLLNPILTNVLAILFTAVLFNAFFQWRRYPVHFSRLNAQTNELEELDEILPLTTEDFNSAIRELDSFVDLTEEGLSELLEKAKQKAKLHVEHPAEIIAGKIYSNGKIGQQWVVRHVIDAGNIRSKNDLVIYKTVAGKGLYNTGMLEREEFRRWARFEVYESNGRWLKVD